MTCREATEQIVEYSRRQEEPGALLAAHLASCGVCRDRWHADRALTTQLGIIRIGASARRSPDARRAELLDEFARAHRRPVALRYAPLLAAAAALALAVGLMRNAERVPPPAADAQGIAQATDIAELQDEGFIAVPYAPPLATNETLRVEHLELYPAALASLGVDSLGVDVDPKLSAGLPADVLVGQDGLPRAVRISDGYSPGEGF